MNNSGRANGLLSRGGGGGEGIIAVLKRQSVNRNRDFPIEFEIEGQLEFGSIHVLL